jgi:nicotinamide-nucleotide amidase
LPNDTALTISPALCDRAKAINKALKSAGLSIVTAESCTAGMIAAVLSRADGAGEVLHGGFGTYTKAHKTSALGVSADLLREKGAVNEDVVTQLATGALNHSPASLSLAVSGVLGPEEDEGGNPVGLVYFCRVRSGGQPVVVKGRIREKETGAAFAAHDRARLRSHRILLRRIPRLIGTAAARRACHSSSVLDAFERLHGRHAVARLVRALEPPLLKGTIWSPSSDLSAPQ